MKRLRTVAVAVLFFSGAIGSLRGQQSGEPTQQGSAFRFRSGVELINVTATVSDASGRFVSGLRMEDFVVYEDDKPQTITHFEAERVPVSLGLVLDTSGSMAGDKIRAARTALDRFLYDLLDEQDEIFVYRFSDEAELVQTFTGDRRQLSRALNRIQPKGGTAMYDAVADAIPLAETGRYQKKALVIISDGNDTSSETAIVDVERRIRESEVMVYAIGIDGEAEPVARPAPMPPRPRSPLPIPMPFPPRRGRWPGQGGLPFQLAQGPFAGFAGAFDRVNIMALRDITDVSGGRTEVIRDAKDLDPATEGIANELSQQYYIGYPAPDHRDGQWHSIRVEVPKRGYRVRARRGYVAG